MKSTILLLTLSLATGSALASLPLGLRPRQQGSCAQEEMADCGAGCVPLTYTCCPDGSGGCPTTAVCVLADNGEYGCCPLDEECSGPGGATTLPGETYTSTMEGSPAPTPSSSESFGSLTFASTPSVTTPSMTPVSSSTPFESASTPSMSTPSVFTPSMSSASSPTPASTTTPTSAAVPVAAAAATDFAGAAFFGGAVAVAVALL